MHPGQVKLMSGKLGIFTNKYADVLLSVSEYKIVQRLFEENIFKVMTLDNIIIFKEIIRNI